MNPTASCCACGRTEAVFQPGAARQRQGRQHAAPEPCPLGPVVAAFGREDAVCGQCGRQQPVAEGKAVVDAVAEIKRRPRAECGGGADVAAQPLPELCFVRRARVAAGRIAQRAGPASQAAGIGDVGAERALSEVGREGHEACEFTGVGLCVEQSAETADRDADDPDRLVALAARRRHHVLAQAVEDGLIVVVAEMRVDQHRVHREPVVVERVDEAFADELLGVRVRAGQHDDQCVGVRCAGALFEGAVQWRLGCAQAAAACGEQRCAEAQNSQMAPSRGKPHPPESRRAARPAGRDHALDDRLCDALRRCEEALPALWASARPSRCRRTRPFLYTAWACGPVEAGNPIFSVVRFSPTQPIPERHCSCCSMPRNPNSFWSTTRRD